MPKDSMGAIEAQECFTAGESAITALIPTDTPKNRARNVARLKLGTLVKLMQANKRAHEN